MIKQKLKISSHKRWMLGTAVAVTLLLSPVIRNSIVNADQFDQQIQALQQQNDASQQVSDQLSAQANSYQAVVNQLQSQINSVQQTIVTNQNKSDDLQNQINAAQVELDHQKKVLGEDIKTMYLEGRISTIEMLATSKDLSQYVDKQQYRDAVQNKVKTGVDTINKLKSQLKSQQSELQALIQTQKIEQAQLNASQAQQAQLLAFTEGQKAAYDQQIAANQSKISDLRHQQILANTKYSIGSPLPGDPNHGGYPTAWSNAPQDSLIDYWGMYNRECVSYTAFKVHQAYLNGKGHYDMPNWGGIGNANQWDDNARAAGIPTDTNPTPGSIAISNAGTWGHAMYVEQVGNVNGQQAIYVSQYNASLDGTYSEGWRYTTGLVFIHF